MVSLGPRIIYTKILDGLVNTPMVLCQEWALGMSQPFFFKAGQLKALEDKRSEGRTDFVLKLLSWGERFLNEVNFPVQTKRINIG